ncbi:hypothetical protein AAY84_12245 [Serratia marcescens]|uniref:type II toxin-antitoxin system RelE/ParE family toxin n=1 Tax=Serratia marcescens TaxID=615 RepID=UPI00062C6D8B|nr:type II toxin-antitoxin system RelE/ParE family toxin [Serratia marcescens]KKZ18115.1 hypothetical protein AAY84_12245 [Serratia marcescens]
MAGKKITVIYSDTARMTIKTIADFLRFRQIEHKSVIAKILDEFEGKTMAFPEGSPICAELLSLGCSKYRECNTADGYRVLYSIASKSGGVVIHVNAVISQRQSISGLLFSRIIEWQ